RAGVRGVGVSQRFRHRRQPHPNPSTAGSPGTMEGEGTRLSAERTFCMTCSTVTSEMQNGLLHFIFGYGVLYGYMKHGAHGLSGLTTRSRLPNGQTRSGSAGAKIVTARVSTAAARCARPESDPEFSAARSRCAAADPKPPAHIIQTLRFIS